MIAPGCNNIVIITDFAVSLRYKRDIEYSISLLLVSFKI